MGFVLDGLDTEAYDRNYSDRELLARILSYFRPYRRRMLLVAVMITLNSAAGTGGPILISSAVDMLAQNPTIAGMWLMAGGVLLLGGCRLDVQLDSPVLFRSCGGKCRAGNTAGRFFCYHGS